MATSRNENAANTARFCVEVVTTDLTGMKRLGQNAEFITDKYQSVCSDLVD